MPLYEYRCKSCGHTFEIIQKFSDRPLKKCPECAGSLEKLISRTSFQLKGGGWFVSDYSSSKASPPSGETKPAESKPSGTGSGSKHTCGTGCSH